jgi:glutamate-5-semialdehyde dehydrogenase
LRKKHLKHIAKEIINSLIKSGCEVRVDNKINKLFQNKLKIAKEKDWTTEYLDAVISIKTVKNVNDGVQHILKYGTMHTDSIITKNSKNAKFS